MDPFRWRLCWRCGTASATKRNWDVTSLNKAGVVEEEEGMGHKKLRLSLSFELID